ncbi:MAG: hypothetical protein AAAB11_18480 [Rhizobium giardinii]
MRASGGIASRSASRSILSAAFSSLGVMHMPSCLPMSISRASNHKRETAPRRLYNFLRRKTSHSQSGTPRDRIDDAFATAMEKLQAGNVAEAVFRAVRMNLIS